MGSLDLEGQDKAAMSKEIEHVSVAEPSFSPEEEKALVRKIDLTLLPTIWIMYLLSYLDRTKCVDPALTPAHMRDANGDSCSIGNAKISGMETDLNLSSNEYSIALVVFFVGYVVFEVPSKYVYSPQAHWNLSTNVIDVQPDPGSLSPIALPPRHHDPLGTVDMPHGRHQGLQAPRRSACHHRLC